MYVHVFNNWSRAELQCILTQTWFDMLFLKKGSILLPYTKLLKLTMSWKMFVSRWHEVFIHFPVDCHAIILLQHWWHLYDAGYYVICRHIQLLLCSWIFSVYRGSLQSKQRNCHFLWNPNGMFTRSVSRGSLRLRYCEVRLPTCLSAQTDYFQGSAWCSGLSLVILSG